MYLEKIVKKTINKTVSPGFKTGQLPRALSLNLNLLWWGLVPNMRPLFTKAIHRLKYATNFVGAQSLAPTLINFLSFTLIRIVRDMCHYWGYPTSDRKKKKGENYT